MEQNMEQNVEQNVKQNVEQNVEQNQNNTKKQINPIVFKILANFKEIRYNKNGSHFPYSKLYCLTRKKHRRIAAEWRLSCLNTRITPCFLIFTS